MKKDSFISPERNAKLSQAQIAARLSSRSKGYYRGLQEDKEDEFDNLETTKMHDFFRSMEEDRIL